MSRDTVKRNCPFFNDSISCEKLQPKRNCYQCPLANFEILKSENERLRSHSNEIEKENKQLRFLLGDKNLREYKLSVDHIKE